MLTPAPVRITQFLPPGIVDAKSDPSLRLGVGPTAPAKRAALAPLPSMPKLRRLGPQQPRQQGPFKSLPVRVASPQQGAMASSVPPATAPPSTAQQNLTKLPAGQPRRIFRLPEDDEDLPHLGQLGRATSMPRVLDVVSGLPTLPAPATSPPSLALACFGDLAATAAALEEAVLPVPLAHGSCLTLGTQQLPHQKLTADVLPTFLGGCTRSATSPVSLLPALHSGSDAPMPRSCDSGASRRSAAVWLPTPDGRLDDRAVTMALCEGNKLPLSFLRSLAF